MIAREAKEQGIALISGMDVTKDGKKINKMLGYITPMRFPDKNDIIDKSTAI